jgi:hydrogenase expression/formation protein HypD
MLGVGFETTAPGVAAALVQAEAERLANFSVLSLHKLTPPAMRAILGAVRLRSRQAGDVPLDGIIGPGHVSAVIGSDAWSFLPREYRIACAVAGFEPLDLLGAIASLVQAVVQGIPVVDNVYMRGVRPEGNPTALALLNRVFEADAAAWRGLGELPASGLRLRPEWAHHDAARLFPVAPESSHEPPGCRCGDIVRGRSAPMDCPLFRRVCTPENPIGPCMVSNEGACTAVFQYAVDF